jgi:hypothetical protein
MPQQAAEAPQAETAPHEGQFAAVDLTAAAPSSGLIHITLGARGPGSGRMRFTLTQGPRHGTAVLMDPLSGLLRYMTRQAPLGEDSLQYTVTVGEQTSEPATLRLRIVPTGLRGRLTYDAVPTLCSAESCGLDYASLIHRPIRNVAVQLFAAADLHQPLSETVSDELGAYVFPQMAPGPVVVQVLAAMLDPNFVVRDNTQSGATYALRSEPLEAWPSPTVNLHAPSSSASSPIGANSGGADAADAARSAAPFAVLDTLYTASQAFAAVRPTLRFAPLTAYWSAANEPQVGSTAQGHITTSHWDGRALYVLGAADIDTDEYDAHVLIHEWAHYFEATQSRSDSPGGPHGPGEQLDMRLAFSEGLGNAMGALLLYPDTQYADTQGPGQQRGIGFDISRSAARDPTPGVDSELSVQGLLYSLFAAEPSVGDSASTSLGLGLGSLYDALNGPHAHSAALTSLLTFVTGLKELLPDAAARIDATVAAHRLPPIVDRFGHGALAIYPANAPAIYQEAFVGTPCSVAPLQNLVASSLAGASTTSPSVTSAVPLSGLPALTQAGTPAVAPAPMLQLPAATTFNKLASNRYVHFVGTGQLLRVQVDCPAPTALFLYGPRSEWPGYGLQLSVHNNAQEAFGCGPGLPCTTWLQAVPTLLGADYSLNLQSPQAGAQSLPCTVTLLPL